MLAEERHRRIGEYLQKVEFASLEELAKHLDVSTSTIRRDLTHLETTGTLQRTHGGARLSQPPTEEFTFTTRDMRQFNEKEAIAQACAARVHPNQSIIMDAGTTVYHVARYLEPLSPQIITNSLPIANHFASTNRVEIVLSGGVLYPRLGVLVGPLAVEAFRSMNADIAIMSAGGITAEGISNSHGLLIEIQRAMMNAVRKVIFCLDHSKFDRRSLLTLCDLTPVHEIITDARAPRDLIDVLRAKGIEVIIAPSSAPVLEATS